MRQRLAGASPHVLLDRFVDTLEPVKGYARGAEKNATNTPLNRLVDSIPPESNAARVFRDAVDAYLAGPPERRYSAHMRTRLAEWGEDARTIRPIFESNSLLTENVPVADSMAALCQAGIEALLALDPATQATNARDAAWKERASAAAKDGATRKGDILIQIAPAVVKLVDAVNVAPGQ
jgi:hexosaminidase